jgi:hypothetical protein
MRLTRIFHAPRDPERRLKIRLHLEPGDTVERIFLNDLSLDWCKMDSRIDSEIADLIQPTNRLTVELAHPDPTLSQPPFDVWLEITEP